MSAKLKVSNEEILELLQSGKNQSEIAETLGVSPAAISKRLRKIVPNVPANEPNRQERLRDKLLAVSCAPVDGWLNERDRMEILASLMAKHIDPLQVCAAFTISRDEYQRYLEDPHYQQRLEYYRNLAKQAPENAVKLAQGSAHDVMMNLIAISHSCHDEKARLSAAKEILNATKILSDEKPKITINLSQQEITMIVKELKTAKERHTINELPENTDECQD